MGKGESEAEIRRKRLGRRCMLSNHLNIVKELSELGGIVFKTTVPRIHQPAQFPVAGGLSLLG